MKTKSDPRHQSRIVALQKLFEHEFKSNSPFEIADLQVINEDDQPGQVDEKFAIAIFAGVIKDREKIDTILQQYTKKRPFADTAKVDLLILRISIYEFMFSEFKIPDKVIIDEAVELAKEFGGEKSSNFVNGVLGSILSNLRND